MISVDAAVATVGRMKPFHRCYPKTVVTKLPEVFNGQIKSIESFQYTVNGQQQLLTDLNYQLEAMSTQFSPLEHLIVGKTEISHPVKAYPLGDTGEHTKLKERELGNERSNAILESNFHSSPSDNDFVHEQLIQDNEGFNSSIHQTNDYELSEPTLYDEEMKGEKLLHMDYWISVGDMLSLVEVDLLIGDDPSVQKSSLLLQMVALMGRDCDQPACVIYEHDEESLEQISSRVERIEIGANELYFCVGINIEDLLVKIQPLSPQALIVDSIQNACLREVTENAEGLSLVRTCTSALLRFVKKTNIPILLAGMLKVALTSEIEFGVESRMVPMMGLGVSTVTKLGYKKCIVLKSVAKSLATLDLGKREMIDSNDLKRGINTMLFPLAVMKEFNIYITWNLVDKVLYGGAGNVMNRKSNDAMKDHTKGTIERC
ncbi:hypothetical protein F3Y22_tig00112957pilonHSYRG00031 [Hibiscus syriacus]|uniref:Uncharacterized protein n=1 Tax=Hibiscus syriacus TaxID=106335 RepID=A0A6A2Y1K2_HIBSY|nr:hypothetical protein F3Y22_tig00112957pilonHSYRG00031 [Hibiscus syriacus]